MGQEQSTPVSRRSTVPIHSHSASSSRSTSLRRSSSMSRISALPPHLRREYGPRSIRERYEHEMVDDEDRAESSLGYSEGDEGIITVVGSHQEEFEDKELRLLGKVHQFVPLLKPTTQQFTLGSLLGNIGGSAGIGLGAGAKEDDSIDYALLDYEPVLDIFIGYQSHIRRCALEVSNDQKTLVDKIKNVDEFANKITTTMAANLMQARANADQMAAVDALVKQAERTNQLARSIFQTLHKLDALLPADDALSLPTVASVRWPVLHKLYLETAPRPELAKVRKRVNSTSAALTLHTATWDPNTPVASSSTTLNTDSVTALATPTASTTTATTTATTTTTAEPTNAISENLKRIMAQQDLYRAATTSNPISSIHSPINLTKRPPSVWSPLARRLTDPPPALRSALKQARAIGSVDIDTILSLSDASEPATDPAASEPRPTPTRSPVLRPQTSSVRLRGGVAPPSSRPRDAAHRKLVGGLAAPDADAIPSSDRRRPGHRGSIRSETFTPLAAEDNSKTHNAITMLAAALEKAPAPRQRSSLGNLFERVTEGKKGEGEGEGEGEEKRVMGGNGVSGGDVEDEAGVAVENGVSVGYVEGLAVVGGGEEEVGKTGREDEAVEVTEGINFVGYSEVDEVNKQNGEEMVKKAEPRTESASPGVEKKERKKKHDRAAAASTSPDSPRMLSVESRALSAPGTTWEPPALSEPRMLSELRRLSEPITFATLKPMVDPTGIPDSRAPQPQPSKSQSQSQSQSQPQPEPEQPIVKSKGRKYKGIGRAQGRIMKSYAS